MVDDVVAVTRFVANALVIFLAAVVVRIWLRRRERPSAWAAATFGLLGSLIVASLIITELMPWALESRAVVNTVLALLVLFPYLLYRFAASFAPMPAWFDRLATGLIIVVVGTSVVLPRVPVDGPRPEWVGLYLAFVIANWTMLSCVAAVRLWRRGRGLPTVARRRMRLLGAGTALLNLVLFLGQVAAGAPNEARELATGTLTLVSTAMFLVGLAPPEALRLVWRRREEEALRAAQVELMAATTAEQVAEHLLPPVVDLIGGGRVELHVDGKVLSARGAHDDAAAGRNRLTSLTFGPLHVQVSTYTPYFGREELGMLGSVGVLADLALARCQLLEDQLRAEETLRRTNLQLEEAQRVARLGSWEWTIDTNEMRWSDESFRLRGLEPGAVAPLDAIELTPVAIDDQPVVDQALADALAGQRDFECEYRLHRADGRQIWVHTRGVVQRGDDGSPTRMYGTVMDITETKEAEQALRQTSEALATARDAAVEASRLKSEFLATMSHEIRTPMNGVIGLNGLLLATELDERQRQYAEGVQAAGQALLAIINDILDFSKIEAGMIELESIDFDLLPVVDEVAEIVAETAHRKNLELAVDVDPRLPAGLLGDPTRIRQVLLNLASNAVKFTEEGEVVLRARQVATEADQVVVRIDVTDTGIGIDERDQARLFDPFSQADASTTRRFGGTGLGLAISRQLISAMGGELTLTSRPGQGSTFSFTVPFTRGSERARPVPAGPHSTLVGAHALLVDDNETNLLILCEQLRMWGLRPESATDAAGALALAAKAAERNDAFDLALLDLCMPDVDGIELARRLHAAPGPTPHLVLLSSAGSMTTDEVHAAGIDATLTKPVRSSVLFDTLVRVTAAPAAPAPEPVAEAQESRPARAHLLVVEDNEINRLVAIGMLQHLGYTADVATNGAEALDALAQRSYAAVLMDCQMPVMDGYTATGRIRRNEAGLRHTPIIAMTAGAIEGDRERCLAAGMDDYIPKPVDADRLDRVLAHWTSAGAEPAASVANGPGAARGPNGSSGAPPDRPVINLDRIAELRAVDQSGGGLLAELVSAFVEGAPAAVTTMADAVGSHDDAALRRAAHRLRGSAAAVGAERLAELCAEVEGAARDAPQATVEHLDLVAAEVERVVIALRDEQLH